MVILCRFRKLHCTRNFIHMNLFVSFILRAISVFIKDGVLYAEEENNHCVSTIECKAVMVFFHYCVMSNYFWLFIEGLYLFTLLVETFFPERRYFYWYTIIGWVWSHFGFMYNLENANLVIFSSCVQKCYCKPKRANQHSCKMSELSTITLRLARSTLLLIPLFGIHYTVFAFSPENVSKKERLVFELGLGSFQGFVVAVLYCFLNGELSTLKNDLFKFLPKGAVRNKEEMEELESQPVLCCGFKTSSSITGEQRSERGDATVNSEQEQLSDSDVEHKCGESADMKR
ncbi:UNVERIFIED_CONTAM: hypothetical protein FKN15_063149 [Acipenser sinensis]